MQPGGSIWLSSYNILGIPECNHVRGCTVKYYQPAAGKSGRYALNEQPEDVNEQLQEYSVMAERWPRHGEKPSGQKPTIPWGIPDRNCCGIDACLATIGTSPRQTKDQLELISRYKGDGIKEILQRSASVSQLRPDALERFSLEYAISKMVSDMNAVSGARVYFDCQVKNLKLMRRGKCHLQGYPGGITNAPRHGHASQIWITIKKEDTDILLQIRDNGIRCKR